MALTSITKDFITRSGLVVEGTASISSSTAQTGAFQVSGGAAIGKNLIVGSTATLWGPTTLQNSLSVAKGATLNQGLTVAGVSTLSNIVNIAYAGNSDSALIISGANGRGGVGYQDFLKIQNTGSGVINGEMSFRLDSVGSLQIINSGYTTQLLQLDQLGVLNTNGLYITGDADVTGAFNSTGTLSVNKNLFTVDGGTGNTAIAGTLYTHGNVGFNGTINSTGTVTITSTAAVSNDGTAGALIVNGGTYIGGQLYTANTATFNKDVYITGALYVEGGQTIVNSTAIQTGDKVIYVSTGSETAATANGAGLVVGPIGSEFITLEYDGSLGNGGRPNWVSSGGLVSNVTASSTSTVLANAIISANGGIGANGNSYINGDLAVSGLIYGTTVEAENLTGGAALEVAYQTAANTTGFVSAPTLNNQVLSYNATSGQLEWMLAQASSAETTTNIKDGAKYDIPFQTDVSKTSFSADFQWNYDNNYLKINTISVWSNIPGSNGFGSAANQIVDTLGDGIELFSQNYAQLNSNNQSTVSANTTGVSLSTVAGAYTAVLDTTTGNFTLGGTTGGGSLKAAYVNPLNFNNTEIAFYNSTAGNDNSGALSRDASFTYANSTLTVPNATLSTSLALQYATATGVAYVDGSGNLVSTSGFTYDGTTVTVPSLADSALTVAGGIVFADAGILTDSADLTWDGTTLSVTGYVSAGTITALNSIVLDYATNNAVAYVDAQGNVATDNVFTYNGTTVTAPNLTVNANGNLTVSSGGSVTLDYATVNGIAYVDGSNNLVAGSTFTYDGTTVTVGGTTDTTGNQDGALVVDGGVYVAKKVFIEDSGNDTLADYNGAGALAVNGGIAVNNNIAISSVEPTLGGFRDTPSFGTQGGVYVGKDLYVGTTATINGDLLVDGTIYVQGASLTGVDKITGSTGTFVDIVSTGTIYSNAITATSLTVTGQVNLPNFRSTNSTITNLTVTGNTNVQGFTATNAVLTNLFVQQATTVAGFTATGIMLVTDAADGYVLGKANTVSSNGTWSFETAGGIAAAKNITAGGVVSAGDLSAAQGNDTGSVDTFYAVNNMQSARTISDVVGTGAVIIDMWSTSLYTSSKYLVQVVDGSNIHVEEIMVVQDGTNVYVSEYGIVTNNGELGTFSGSIGGGNITILFTPTGASNATIQVVRQSILTALETF